MLELSGEQIRLLKRFIPEFREFKGVGKVYLQAAIDCHTRFAWARLHPNKLPIAAVQSLDSDVLPTFEGARRQDRAGFVVSRHEVDDRQILRGRRDNGSGCRNAGDQEQTRRHHARG